MAKTVKFNQNQEQLDNEETTNVNEELTNVNDVTQEEIAQTPNGIPPMPEVRAVPIWAPDASISVTGAEWEAIQNMLANLQVSAQAIQAVMSRNIIEGTIKLDYQKLNSKTLTYEEMTDEEKAPYEENTRNAIEKLTNKN